VRGTNPKTVESWKSSLFHDFYERVKRACGRLEAPVDQEELSRRRARPASCCRATHGHAQTATVWSRMNDGYSAPHARGDRLAHRLLAER